MFDKLLEFLQYVFIATIVVTLGTGMFGLLLLPVWLDIAHVKQPLWGLFGTFGGVILCIAFIMLMVNDLW